MDASVATKSGTFVLIMLSSLFTIDGASSDGFYFTVNPSDQDVEEGQALRLRCAVTPAKDIFYSWLHNGERVEPDQDYGRRYLEANSNLQIPHADRELDQGTYQCQALNKSSTFTTASQEAHVNIYWLEPYVQVVLVKPTRFEEIRLGQEMELACQASANPPVGPANIKWFHNGNARLPNTKFLPNGNLLIAVLGVQHVGSYHCRVVHAAGKLDSRPPFVVQFDDSEPPAPITTLKHEDFNRFVMRGHTVELRCPERKEVKTGDDIPPITVWGFMQRLGEQQQSVTTLPDIKLLEMDSKLVIENFEAHHVNYYTCEVGSHVSPDRSVYIFQVEMATIYPPKRSDFSPRLKKNQPYVVKIGHNAELRYYPDNSPATSFLVDQISNPTPYIEWRKKGESQPLITWPPIPNHSPGLGRFSSETTAEPRIHALRGKHLVVRDAVETDAGSYEMILSNFAGRVSILFDLIVTFPPEFYIPQTPEQMSFDEDESATLDCGIKRRSTPGSTVYWEKDNNVLMTNTHSLMIMENNGEVLRFPKLKPESQGHYQCFVQTEGYATRTPGRQQELIVKAKLQFFGDMRDHFLEVNTMGRIACKVRGHGSISVDWYRVTGPHQIDLHPIRAPNHVEPGGLLVIQYAQKSDAGKYMCVAQSTYKKSRINATINIVVGEKPRITQISSNQTVRVGSHLVLHCHATGDPPPQVSWIARRNGFVLYNPQSEPINEKQSEHNGVKPKSVAADIPSDSSLLESDPMMAAILVQNSADNKGRVIAYPNGSLVITEASTIDQAEYFCVANNKHAVETKQGLFVRVLSAEEYTRLQLGGDGSNSGMLKTILTVVGCAVTYLALIIALTVFCSMRMVRKRGKRPSKGAKAENGQLLTSLGEPNLSNGITGNVHIGNNIFDQSYLMQVANPSPTGNGSTQYAHLHTQKQCRSTRTNISGPSSGAFAYPDPAFQRATLQNRSTPSDGLGTVHSRNFKRSRTDSQEWWSWKTHGFFNPLEMQLKVPHGTPASPQDLTSESAVENTIFRAQNCSNAHMLNPTPCSYFYNGQPSNADTSTTTTSASDPHLMSAPPPTPLDSRSHLSGLSSGNSTSLYSRSMLSGTSHNGAQFGYGPSGSDVSPIYGVPGGASFIAQMDRLYYPRSELKIESLLGNGIFGEVFQAKARHLQEDGVFSTVLVKSLTVHEKAVEFQRELELFCKLNNKHVAQLLGVCAEQEPFYMILEHYEWGDLKSFLRRIRESDHPLLKMPVLTCDQKIKFCYQISMGMEHLAQMHCVHCDLAARNIVISHELELKITSLSLCRDAHATDYYRMPNTEEYIPLRWFAPELILATFSPNHGNSSINKPQADYVAQISGHNIPFTVHSDVWAFAIVVCEIFSMATLPLSRLTDQEIIVTGSQAAVTAAEESSKDESTFSQSALRPDLPAEIPEDLSNLLRKCWTQNAKCRPEFKNISASIRGLISRKTAQTN